MEKINLITPEDMATFDRIDRDCLKMHVCPPPKTFINMKVHDANGNLTLDMDMPSRSWVRNAYIGFLGRAVKTSTFPGSSYEAGSGSPKDIGGIIRTHGYIGGSYAPPELVNTSANNSYGIVVGSGSDAESFDSFKLSSIIASGTGSGQLSYAAMSGGVATYESGTKKWSVVHTRVFNNNGGAEVSVNEVGLYGYVVSVPVTFMLCRDLLPAPVVVNSAAQLTVTYTIEMTFPA